MLQAKLSHSMTVDVDPRYDLGQEFFFLNDVKKLFFKTKITMYKKLS